MVLIGIPKGKLDLQNLFEGIANDFVFGVGLL